MGKPPRRGRQIERERHVEVFVDLNLELVAEDDSYYDVHAYDATGESLSVTLPKSKVTRYGLTFTMPKYMAIEKGLMK